MPKSLPQEYRPLWIGSHVATFLLGGALMLGVVGVMQESSKSLAPLILVVLTLAEMLAGFIVFLWTYLRTVDVDVEARARIRRVEHLGQNRQPSGGDERMEGSES